MIDTLTVLITGTNKGIGCDLVKVFLKSNPKCVIIATSREMPQSAYKKWQKFDEDKRIKCKTLDLNKRESIDTFVQEIHQEGITLDIVVNNAGICKADGIQEIVPPLEWSQECLRVNILAQIELTQKLLPFLSNSCKIVNVCSGTGGLKYQPPNIRQKFSSSNITKIDILQAVDQCLEEIKNAKLINFTPNVYGTSKMLFAAWSRFILIKQLKESQICICVSPGLCLTPMTQGFDEKLKAKAHSSESGALKIYETIFLPNLSSEVFYHRARSSNFYLCGEGLPRQ